MKIALVSLGCAKNAVDSEMVLGFFVRNGFLIVSDPESADYIILNTCGFIESAKKEAIDNIFSLLEFKKPLIVIGCLVERYYEELKKEIPEVALFVPVREYPNFATIFNDFLKQNKVQNSFDSSVRIYGTPRYQAYLKISDGCDNCCTYCAIPLIRGRFRSVPFSELQVNIERLAHDNIKELVVIAQDTTTYGKDFGKETIVDVLKETLSYPQFEFIKLLYLYPDEITDELIELIKNNQDRLAPYFDIPIQHASNHLLKDMNRRGTKEEIREAIRKIRNAIPKAILRTTLIIGFPGETDEDIEELLEFMSEIKFDRLGAFTYSREEGTKSYDYPNQIKESVKKARLKKIMKRQQEISYSLIKNRIGEQFKALVSGFNEKKFAYQIISPYFASDDVDGEIFLYSSRPLEIGEIVQAEIVEAFVYDMGANVIN